MQLDQNPVFRDVIVPWYDSDTLCFISIIFSVLVILFGIAGATVAYETAEFHGYLWVPLLLVFLSAGVAVSIATRLIKRYYRRSSR
jgi:hypothetical protein